MGFRKACGNARRVNSKSSAKWLAYQLVALRCHLDEKAGESRHSKPLQPGQRIMKEHPAFGRSKLDVAAAAGWSEPVPGRELYPVESNAFPERTISPTVSRRHALQKKLTPVRPGDLNGESAGKCRSKRQAWSRRKPFGITVFVEKWEN